MSKVIVETKTEFDLDIATAAKWFAALSDDEMCLFLVAVERESRDWPNNADNQWYSLGGHLRTCECSNEATRDMLRAWVSYMETSTHK